MKTALMKDGSVYKNIRVSISKPLINLDYLAGFFDGEGHISIIKIPPKKNRFSVEYKPVVVLTNTQPGIIEDVAKVFGGGYYSGEVRRKKYSKVVYRLHMSNRFALNFCKVMKDRLVIKKEAADLIVQFYGGNINYNNNYPVPRNEIERREKIYQRLKEINFRGVRSLQLIKNEVGELKNANKSI